MSFPKIKQNKTWLVAAAIVLSLAGVFVAGTALAKVAFNTIDTVATLAEKGRKVTLTGPIAVTAGERTFLQVTVTQRTTGAVAEGRIVFTGTGETNQWKVVAKTHGKASFEEGAATATAIATTFDHGKATDAHQWLVNITLVKE